MISVIDLAEAPDAEPGTPGGSALVDGGRPPGIVIAVGSGFDFTRAAQRLDRATLTLTEDDGAAAVDRRVVSVPSVDRALADIVDRCQRWPLASAVCDDVLRAVDPVAPAVHGVITESLAYSVLQAGPEFARWLGERPLGASTDATDPVRISRDGNTLLLRLHRPERHNAFNNVMRAALLDGLAVAALDSSIDEVVLSGAGPSFCSGGDLAEFGGFSDVPSAHLARTRYSPALALDAVAARLGPRCRAEIHGQVLGSGLEMAAYCGRVRAHPDTMLGLPELGLGLIPGAGGTVSITRRIGRWRTAYLVLSGRSIDAATALRWGLVDDIDPAASQTPARSRP